MPRSYRVPVTEADRIRAGLALHLVAACTGVSAEQMAGTDRLPPPACRARWLAFYLAHVAYGWPLERVGHAYGVNRATVAGACCWAEDARDRPALD
ncbi:MAG TPA: chromosomal replication initiator DnaA, partial [Brevundimonas sp.]|nr:chromosomal replication initiator DnaA [Brevundimonas sp.]